MNLNYLIFLILIFFSCDNYQNKENKKNINTKTIITHHTILKDSVLLINYKAKKINWDFIKDSSFYIEYTFDFVNYHKQDVKIDITDDLFLGDFFLLFGNNRGWGGAAGSVNNFKVNDYKLKTIESETSISNLKILTPFDNRDSSWWKTDSFGISFLYYIKDSIKVSKTTKFHRDKFEISDIKNHQYILDYWNKILKKK